MATQTTTEKNETSRAERTRKLIQIGGLAEVAGILETDKGVLLGAFMEIATFIENNDQGRIKIWKRAGDTELNRRDTLRKAQGRSEKS